MEEEIISLDSFEDSDNREFKLFIKALEKQALESIERFFKDRKWFCGGSIPQNHLRSQQSVELVLSTDFLSGIDEIRSLLPKENPPKGFDLKGIDWDTYRLLQIIHEVKTFGIPKSFQCGIILLYMKFCVGVNLPEKKRYLNYGSL